MAAIIQLALFRRQHWAAKLELVVDSHRKEARHTMCIVQPAEKMNLVFIELKHTCFYPES